MRSGFIAMLVIVIVLVGGGYFAYNKFSQLPNTLTKETAKSIQKYTNSKTWQIKDGKSLCVSKTDCNPPVIITFDYTGGWPDVYGFYVNDMGGLGWTTNSSVLTSTPTNVLFVKDDCDAALLKDSEKESATITVTCKI